MSTLKFPSYISQSPSLIRFKFFDSKSTGTTPTRTIILPAPLNLSNNYNVGFDDLEAGLLERAIIDGGEAIAGVVDAVRNPNSDALNIFFLSPNELFILQLGLIFLISFILEVADKNINNSSRLLPSLLYLCDLIEL